ncbi:NAD-dependent epimerase/dehydratase family protein [Paraburkholderia sp. 35.1]|uniref:NAD-dependent epimerase/dehydratase family protein n=1 Tax=unclassified Paraburkholderia TaxID=2615204 RepID=UPI003D227DE7
MHLSKVLPAAHKGTAHEAKLNGVQSISVWSSGSPKREFLHVDDPGSAALALLDADGAEGVFNIGYGRGHCNRGSCPSRL